jgi:hypothetical protein
MRLSVSVFNRASRDAKTRPNRHSSHLGIPSPRAVSRSGDLGDEAENRTKNGTKKPVVGCSDRRTEEEGEETREAEGAERSRGMGEVEIRTRARLAMGAHDRRYKVDEAPFSTGQSGKRARSGMCLFFVKGRLIRESLPASPTILSRFCAVGTGASFTPSLAVCPRTPATSSVNQQTECWNGSHATRGDARNRRRSDWNRWLMRHV